MMAMAGKVMYIPEVTLDYSVGGETISGTRKLDRTFDFSFGTWRLRYDLAARTGFPESIFRGYSHRKLQFLLALAFEMGDRRRRDKALEFAAANGVGQSAKSRILRILTSSAATWRMARAVRHFLRV